MISFIPINACCTRMAGTLYTGAYPSCLLLYFNTSCGMLTPLLNVSMKTFEVEGDQKKHQGAVDKSLSKQQVCVTEGSHLIVLKVGPIHQLLQQSNRLTGFQTKTY